MNLDNYAAAEEARLRRARAYLDAHGGRVSTMSVLDVTERDLEPLWPGVMWLGKPTLLAGDPGLGKSLVTLDIAARLSRGACWPCDCTPQAPGDVAILSAEDDASDVIKPRLRAAGADFARVVLLGHIEEADKGNGHIRRRGIQLDRDIESVKRALREWPRPIKLLIVDPLGAYMGNADTHNNAETRAVLAQLAELAADLRMAVLAVSHLNKGEKGNALYKISGSLAFVAAARAVYLIEQDPQDPARVYMAAAKSNYGTTTRNFAFTKTEADNGAPHVKWEDEPVTLSAQMLLGGQPTAREQAVAADTDKAVAWLHAELIEGPRPGREIQEAAEAAGISRRDLFRASERMRIIKTPGRFRGPWTWALPSVSYSNPPVQ